MDFNDNKPIYRQIEDYAFNCIIERLWPPGKLIPSVRELSAQLGVNSRTVLKALEELLSLGVIEPKRGMGYILCDDAAFRVAEVRRKEFFQTTVPALIDEMHRLGISPQQLIEALYKQ